ncbi:MAG TPA: PIN domain-containing protein [Gemmatimonadaceae bacterium]|nr:PIN domain-containing protein [Gemmatimonadaceae bacterium]
MRVLVDTSALLALANGRDQWHARAVRIARANAASGIRYVSTTLVLAEFHAHVLYVRGPDEARRRVSALLEDPVHEWHPVDAAFASDAVAHWILRYADQRFSLADAVSFELMRRERLKQAFAFDKHFETAGFALLD